VRSAAASKQAQVTWRGFGERSSAAPISRSAMVVARGSGKLNVPVLMAGNAMVAMSWRAASASAAR